jgi:hypothetical protein
MNQSAFYIPCVCGTMVVSHERECRCETCGRLLIIKWGEEPKVIVGPEAKTETTSGQS